MKRKSAIVFERNSLRHFERCRRNIGREQEDYDDGNKKNSKACQQSRKIRPSILPLRWVARPEDYAGRDGSCKKPLLEPVAPARLIPSISAPSTSAAIRLRLARPPPSAAPPSIRAAAVTLLMGAGDFVLPLLSRPHRSSRFHGSPTPPPPPPPTAAALENRRRW